MAETYTLRILVDDSAVRKLEARINRIMSMKDEGGQKKKTGWAGFFQGIADTFSGEGGKKGMIKSVAKLGIIAGAITVIVTMVKRLVEGIVESSPMLRGVLKILDTATMFMLRPIGDFLGFFLRPIAIYFLRHVAVPFYREWAPRAREWGTLLGKLVVGIMGFFADPVGKIVQALRMAAGVPNTTPAPEKELEYEEWLNNKPPWWEQPGWWDSLPFQIPSAYGDTGSETIPENWWERFASDFAVSWASLTDWLQKNVWEPLQYVWTEIVNWFTENIWTPLETTLAPIWEALVTWFNENVGTPLNEILTPVFEKLVTFWDGLGRAIDETILPAWLNFSMLLSDVGSQIEDRLYKAWNDTARWFGEVGTDASSRLRPLWNTIVDVWEAIVNGFISVYNHVRNLIKKWLGITIGPQVDPVNFGNAKASSTSTTVNLRVQHGDRVVNEDTGADIRDDLQASALMEVSA